MNTTQTELEQLSPFQLKDLLIHYAKEHCAGTTATHKFLNAGRGNPNCEISQSRMEDGRHAWQYTDAEIDTLADPAIKAFFLLNPSNPASYAMHPATQQRLVRLVRTKRPDLIVLTDDVYGTFTEGFRSLAADLPQNKSLCIRFRSTSAAPAGDSGSSGFIRTTSSTGDWRNCPTPIERRYVRATNHSRPSLIAFTSSIDSWPIADVWPSITRRACHCHSRCT